MSASDAQTGQKRIEDLTLHEFDMVYSLVRIGDWKDSEIGRVYRLSEEDVRKVFNNYQELLAAAEKIPSVQPQLWQDPSQERIGKPRKRRSDARYATAKERQAAYRHRLQESRRTGIEQPSPANETATPIPTIEEPPVTVCEAPVTETSPEEAETQHSACDSSPGEGSDILENMPVPVTPEACSEREELQVIEE
jgi:hypothetical protein